MQFHECVTITGQPEQDALACDVIKMFSHWICFNKKWQQKLAFHQFPIKLWWRWSLTQLSQSVSSSVWDSPSQRPVEEGQERVDASGVSDAFKRTFCKGHRVRLLYSLSTIFLVFLEFLCCAMGNLIFCRKIDRHLQEQSENRQGRIELCWWISSLHGQGKSLLCS